MKTYPSFHNVSRTSLGATLAVLLLGTLLTGAAHAQIFQLYVDSAEGGHKLGAYTVDASNGSVSASNSSFISSLNDPYGLALDSSNNLVISTLGDSYVAKYSSVTANTSIAPNPLVTAAAVNVTVSGNVLYVPLRNGNGVGLYNATTGATGSPAFLSGGTGGAIGTNVDSVSLDPAHDIGYVVSESQGNVYSFTISTNIINPTPLISGLSTPWDSQYDGAGHLFVSLPLSNQILEYNVSDSSLVMTISNSISGAALSGCYDFTLDGAGHIFISNYTSGVVGEYSAIDGSTINNSVLSIPNAMGIVLIPVAVPEPSSMALVGVVALTFGAWKFRRRR
ncbi:MAG: PEP-CTERM sorting domain-containing protein [Chthoniobacterales bacterium]